LNPYSLCCSAPPLNVLPEPSSSLTPHKIVSCTMFVFRYSSTKISWNCRLYCFATSEATICSSVDDPSIKIAKQKCSKSAKSTKAFARFFAANLSLNCSTRSEEHTSELQSRFDLVCRLLLEKKKKLKLITTS